MKLRTIEVLPTYECASVFTMHFHICMVQLEVNLLTACIWKLGMLWWQCGYPQNCIRGFEVNPLQLAIVNQGCIPD